MQVRGNRSRSERHSQTLLPSEKWLSILQEYNFTSKVNHFHNLKWIAVVLAANFNPLKHKGVQSMTVTLDLNYFISQMHNYSCLSTSN